MGRASLRRRSQVALCRADRQQPGGRELCSHAAPWASARAVGAHKIDAITSAAGASGLIHAIA